MAYLATIRYTPAASVYVRLVDGQSRYFDWLAQAWVAEDTAPCHVVLTEQDDSASLESRYLGLITLPSTGLPAVLEYVVGVEVIGEEPVTTGTLMPEPQPADLAALKLYLDRTDNADDVLLNRLLAASLAEFLKETGASFTALPADVSECLVEMAADGYQRKKRKGAMTVSLATGETTSYPAFQRPASIQQCIDRYKVWGC